MLLVTILFCLIDVEGLPQINLYSTNSMNVFQHHCIRLYGAYKPVVDNIEMTIFCLSELPSTFAFDDDEDYSDKWTFDELLKLNITSEQLLSWSASIDLVEDYQLSIADKSLLKNRTFFNCTDFQFGDRCEYELITVDNIFSYSNLPIEDYLEIYYYQFGFDYPITCYVSLPCTYRIFSSDCLGWNEICDGKIDCLNGIDEENCLEIEANQCEIDEFRCRNGQCIPKMFYLDEIGIEDCYDQTDETDSRKFIQQNCMLGSGPSFACEEVVTVESVLGRRKDRIDKYTNMTNLPDLPVLFGRIYFIYYPDLWICFVQNSEFIQYLNEMNTTLIDNKICIDSQLIFENEDFSFTREAFFRVNIMNLQFNLTKFHLPWNYTSTICNQSSMYQCIHSIKCISIHRIFDSRTDCPFDDDENITLIMKSKNLIEYLNKTHFKCETNEIYLPQSLIGDGDCDCTRERTIYCEDEDFHITYLKKNIIFQHICDGFIDMNSLYLNGKFENDETNCDFWKCDNMYTHCNDIWNCRNGFDEINCLTNNFRCVSKETNDFIDLPINRINDRIIDCIGGYDEIEYCAKMNQFSEFNTEIFPKFACQKQNATICIYHGQLCDGTSDCDDKSDESFCRTQAPVEPNRGICVQLVFLDSDIEKFLCNYILPTRIWHIIPFRIDNQTVEDSSLISKKVNDKFQLNQAENYCHRGLTVRHRRNQSKQICFCPLSYYGSKCQYENERVSLSVRFRAYADSLQRVFSILILLIEKKQTSAERFIHSYEQLQYFSLKDCEKKFSFYLTYLTRTKNRTGKYEIEFHFYETQSFVYHGTFIYPLKFSFLPVHRVSLLVDIPNAKNVDKQNQQCDCAQDALCFDKTIDNRSICICALNKFGRRCLLEYSKVNKCQHNGFYIARSNHEYICQCRSGFFGEQCQFNEKKIHFQFDKFIDISQSIFIHFIDIQKEEIFRTTIFQINLFKQRSFEINWSQSYRLIFIELSNKQYYLTNLVEQNHLIEQANRCVNLTELFDENFHQLHLIHQIKYFQLPCQNHSLNLSCFHDEIHMCLCYEFQQTNERLANCFRFDHYEKYDCFGRNQCENNGQCLQDKQDCPTKAMCLCRSCFYGRNCQFQSNGFGLSLDAILGYQILPVKIFASQFLSIHLSLIATIVFYFLGLINGLFSLMTFQNKVTRDIGCGLYLFVSSINSLVLIHFFLFKFLLLLLTQMTILLNKHFIKIQCYSMDFLLRICLVYNQWLNACVAVERALMVIHGPRFVKRTSKQIAKVLIWIVLSIIIISCIHDPINRRLIVEKNDIDENERLWCIVSYSSTIQIYHYFIHSLHFICPFMINILSTIILVIQKTRQQRKTQVKRTFKDILGEEFRKLQHILISFVILIALQIPYLVLTFLSKCMKSADDFWIFLIGYFISFIPSMLTFIIFVLSSKFYKKEFKKTAEQCRKAIRQYLHLSA